MAERFVESVVGVLRLVAGFTGKVEVRALSWQDAQNPSKQGSIAPNLMRVSRRPDPTELLELTADGEALGAALIGVAERDSWVGRVCQVVAGDAGWPRVYMLLELLKVHYSAKTAKGWGSTFAALCERHGVSKSGLKDLRRTASYHRHATQGLPVRPWPLPEAQDFVLRAVKLAVAEYVRGEHPAEE